MSLHRVNLMESWEHQRGSPPAQAEHRKMSFNPVGNWVPPAANEEPLAGIGVSPKKRALQVIVAVIYCLLAAGIVFGYAAFKPVLVREGVYRDLCTEEDSGESNRTCYEQEIRLNLMFTTAAVATNICALPVGTLLDKYGPRVSSIIGSILLAIGSLFFAFATRLPFDAYIPGYLFLALGGPFVFISSFHLSNTFPRHSGLILALLTGAFDSSSAVFLFYRLTYTATDGAFTPQKLFSVYLIVPLFILIVQLLIMPSQSYKTMGELLTRVESASDELDSSTMSNDDGDSQATINNLREESRRNRETTVNEVTSLLGKKGKDDKQQEEQKKKEISGVWGALHGKSALQQIKSPWFVLITLFTVVQMTRINYFVATIRPQYEYLLNEYLLKDYELAEYINNVFDVALPLGGVLSIPFIGLLLDNTSTLFVLGLLVFLATTIGVLGVLPYAWAAYANIVIFVLYRPFYYTAVSDYAAKVFGFHTFGKVYGLIICLAGLLNFSQSGLDALTHKAFKKDPIPVNVMLLGVALLVGIALIAYVWRKSRQMQREYLEDEAEDAEETRMPLLGTNRSAPSMFGSNGNA